MEACCSSRITSNSQSHGACVCLLYSKLLCTCFGCNRQGVLGRLILRLKIISFFLLFFLKGVCIFLKKTNKKDCVGHLLYVHCFLFNTDVCSSLSVTMPLCYLLIESTLCCRISRLYIPPSSPFPITLFNPSL